MATNPLGKKPGLEIMIGVGKSKPKEGSPAEEKAEPKSEAASEIASGKGTPADKKKVSGGKKPNFKPGPQDKQSAIARRLASLNGGASSTNNDAGNASGGFPGM